MSFSVRSFGWPFVSLIRYCTHCPAASGMRAITPAGPDAIVAEFTCRFAIRASRSALAAGSIDEAQPVVRRATVKEAASHACDRGFAFMPPSLRSRPAFSNELTDHDSISGAYSIGSDTHQLSGAGCRGRSRERFA